MVYENDLFLLQRYRKHTRLNLNANLPPASPHELLQNFPNLRKVKTFANGPIGNVHIVYYIHSIHYHNYVIDA